MLVRKTLPGRAGVAEVDLDVGVGGELRPQPSPDPVEAAAAAKRVGQVCGELDQALVDSLSVLSVRWVTEERNRLRRSTTVAEALRLNAPTIRSLPMSGEGPVGGLGGRAEMGTIAPNLGAPGLLTSGSGTAPQPARAQRTSSSFFNPPLPCYSEEEMVSWLTRSSTSSGWSRTDLAATSPGELRSASPSDTRRASVGSATSSNTFGRRARTSLARWAAIAW